MTGRMVLFLKENTKKICRTFPSTWLIGFDSSHIYMPGFEFLKRGLTGTCQRVFFCCSKNIPSHSRMFPIQGILVHNRNDVIPHNILEGKKMVVARRRIRSPFTALSPRSHCCEYRRESGISGYCLTLGHQQAIAYKDNMIAFREDILKKGCLYLDIFQISTRIKKLGLLLFYHI